MSGTAVMEWLSSWIAEQEVQGSNPGLDTSILEIGYLQLLSPNMTERLLQLTDWKQ